MRRLLPRSRHALDVWDYVAGWYQLEMRLRNSEVLAPIDPSSTRSRSSTMRAGTWRFQRSISRQPSRLSFRTFVIANLRDNDIGSLPFLYRGHNGAR